MRVEPLELARGEALIALARECAGQEGGLRSLRPSLGGGIAVFVVLLPLRSLWPPMARAYTHGMTDVSEALIYYVRATDPASNEQTVYECVGFAMAHAKAAELRMSGYRDVVMSIRNANDNETAA
jgi:hypothetical protein